MNRWAARVAVGAATVLTLAPFGSALIAWHRGWMPTSDWASVVVRSYDSLAGDPPLVGIYSSATTSAGHIHDVYHPGPLQEWLLSLPIHLFAPSTIGALLGSAALVSSCCAIVFVVAWRRGGPRWLSSGVVLVALFMSASGPAMVREPLHTPLATYAMLAFLAAAWAILERDDWFWPIAVFFASVAGQAQVAFLVPAVVVLGVVGAARSLSWVRTRRALASASAPAPAPAGSTRRSRLIALVAAIVTAACWAAPVFDQFFRSGNLWALYTTGRGGGAIGPSWSLSELAKTLAVPPAWLFKGLHLAVDVVDDTRVIWHTSPAEWVTAVVVAIGLGWGLWHTARHGPSTRRSLGTVAVAAIVGCFLASALMPNEAFSLLGHREIWRSAGLFTWWFLVVVVLGALEAAMPAMHDRFRRWAPRVAPVAALLVVAVVVGATFARSSPARDVGSSGFGSVEAFTAVATPRCADGPVVVEPTTLVDSPTALGLIAMLTLRGCEVHTERLENILPGRRHRVTGTEPTTLTIDGFAGGRAGCHLAASYDPAHPPARYRGFASALDRLQRNGPLYLFACP
jgi:hypothetical protein